MKALEYVQKSPLLVATYGTIPTESAAIPQYHSTQQLLAILTDAISKHPNVDIHSMIRNGTISAKSPAEVNQIFQLSRNMR
jgi:hypothetical protein